MTIIYLGIWAKLCVTCADAWKPKIDVFSLFHYFHYFIIFSKTCRYVKTEPFWHCIYIKFRWTWSIAAYSDQKVNFGCLSNKSQQWRLQWIIAELIYFIQHSFKIVRGTVLSGSDRVLIFFLKSLPGPCSQWAFRLWKNYYWQGLELWLWEHKNEHGSKFALKNFIWGIERK